MSEQDARIHGETPLDAVLRKIRLIMALAEDPKTPPDEADAARRKADAMMFEYDIKEIMANDRRPESEKIRPIVSVVDVGPINASVIGYMGTLVITVAEHCRCRVRLWTGQRDGSYLARVYGFESDVRYFEVLYTRIKLHMLKVLIPKVDTSISLDENAYNFHTAGYNWLEMAKFYGWTKVNESTWYNTITKETASNYHVGGIYKRAYYRACERRGEKPTKIPAGGSDGYRKDAASGYITTIRLRLQRMREGRHSGADLILKSAVDAVNRLFMEDNPELFVKQPEAKPCEKCAAAASGHCREHRPVKIRYRKYNEAGYAAGVRHGQTADLDPGVGSTRREIR